MIGTDFKTRQDYCDCLVQLSKNVKPYFSQGKSRLELGKTAALYDNNTIGMEGFSRLLWGLIPLWAGGGQNLLWEEVLEGIRTGTDLSNPDGWGVLYDQHQAFVEMTPMALGLLMTPEKIWNPLNAEEKEAFRSWLLQINDHKLPQNNWYFFRVLVNAALKSVGGTYDPQQMESDLQFIESCYLGDGWYSDGRTKQRDYYISFAMHFYSLIYVKFMKEEDKERCERMAERAKLFAHDFIYWFAEGGEALPYGRSLTYRFAQCAFWCALAFAEVEVYPWGVIRGIIGRHFRYWFEQPILDERGVLTIGYGYPNINMAEGYNAPGSPYWAFKSFLILALPETHPFWQASEEPLPALDKVRAMKHPMMVVTRPDSSNVIALTSGQYPGFDPVHSAEKYAKFAYSSRYAFHVPRSYHLLGQSAPDNMLAFYRDGLYFVRRECKEAIVEGNRIKSIWSPMAGAEVETVLEPYQNGYKCTHTVTLSFDCEAVECGFGIPVDSYHKMKRRCNGNEAYIEAEQDYSRIVQLEGNGEPGEFQAEANTNLLHPRTAIPYISFHLKKGTYTLSFFAEAGMIKNQKGDTEYGDSKSIGKNDRVTGENN